MTLYEKLENHQRRTAFESSDEMAFFLANRIILSEIPEFAMYAKKEDSFSVIRANIIIRSLLNKARIEQSIKEKAKAFGKEAGEEKVSLQEAVESSLLDLPFYNDGTDRIFIPLLSRTINRIYTSDVTKLQEVPYNALLIKGCAPFIDPFDYYGGGLYDSYFTKLILVKKSKNCFAYFDYDAEAIYFVNQQGRLDAKVCLFDRGIKHANKSHMLERLGLVIDAYFRGDKEEFKKQLVEKEFISSKLMNKITSDEKRILKK